jgi:hypothetical protein
MSHTSRPIARQARLLTRQFTAHLTGRQRGPDPHVRRESYDVDDPKAKPWKPIGDGSAGQGLAFRDALVQAADELRHQQWRELPPAEVRAAEGKRPLIAGELERHEAAADSPPGARAALRLELQAIDALIVRARRALRRIDIVVLRGLVHFLDFATGQLFPTYETIAATAGVSLTAAKEGIARLKANGLVDWVRRSIRTDAKGEFAPQREQTSNAYLFPLQTKMAQRTWSRFKQLLTVRLRRLGAIPATVRPGEPTAAEVHDPELRAVLARVGATLTSVSP